MDAPGAGPSEWDDDRGLAGPPADDPLTAPLESEDREVAARELWLRGYIDREQRFRLYFARYIAGLLDNPSQLMRIWRWLIDDFRSERREQAVYLNGGNEAGLLPWLKRRRARRRG